MDGKHASRCSNHGVQLSRWRTVATLIIVILSAGVAVLDAGATYADQPRAHDVTAHSARTIWVHETVHGTNASHQGNTVINDRGTGRGTFNCPIVIQIRIYYTQGEAHVLCTMSTGLIEEGGKISFFSAGPTATFTGTIPVIRGTGKYAHASGHYRVEGTVERKTFVVAATMNGWVSY
jgi:hypothetical protein